MSHLNLETLARLVDDAPDPTEAGHLDICAECRSELEGLRADAAALRMLPDPEPPAVAWLALEQTLKREGLMRRNPWAANLLRLAAVLVIFVLGSVAGALVTRQSATRLATSGAPSPALDPMAARQPLDTPHAPPARVVATAAPLGVPATTAATAATPQEAALLLHDAERSYVSALTRYSELTASTQPGTDAVARLAALESIVATTRAALGQAPADPIINGYHLTAVAQRDATLRQIAASKQQQTWY